MSAKKKAMLCAVATLAGLVIAAPQSGAAAYPTNNFDVTFGASYTRGTITWYDRSVRLTGTMRSLASSGCRRTIGFTYNADASKQLGEHGTSSQCGDAIKALPPIDVPADVPGGAGFVTVCLTDGDGVVLGTAQTPACRAYARSDAS
ncbi:hypothetical protein ATK30_0104 [Amycolatopsis echigonensis]|uniref:Secreted protein n=1 Tax=Amycolatopsis echigonensis TaxID=2576905 RepID=A0A2N3X1N9_9PSEU|nr:hypothetical protein [Amycolatopsis niigatensis]PKW00033.1 hypothetical protein ATK30_0104 [Amycolatopsis niigatensis]